MPVTKLQEHSGSEKAWVYTTVDFADEEQKPELFCIRFASPESETLLHWPSLQLVQGALGCLHIIPLRVPHAIC